MHEVEEDLDDFGGGRDVDRVAVVITGTELSTKGGPASGEEKGKEEKG